ncbi:MAG: FKBP-type peptidyl-prolyl cis-trans isomerase [Ignavibacteriae bacterium]|nr:FKBP-type peptidyl-prolyl cis-trans isomerase [Ignavibacteriota bacterium]
MLKIKILISIISIMLLISCGEKTLTKDDLQTQEEKVSYAIGNDFGKNLKRQKIEVDPEIFLAGLKDANKDSSLYTEEELTSIIMEFQKQQQEKMSETNKVEGEKNKKAGEEFLAANKEKDGVVTTESGLQYKVIEEGNGAKPGPEDTVTVHYRGTLINGEEFDSSYKRNQPATFPVNGVIPGWTEALQLMKAGAKWELYIPSEIAYGARGAGGAIGPNEVLIFEVELLEVSK